MFDEDSYMNYDPYLSHVPCEINGGMIGFILVVKSNLELILAHKCDPYIGQDLNVIRISFDYSYQT